MAGHGTRRYGGPVIALALGALLALAGCGGAATTTGKAQPTATPSPTSTPDIFAPTPQPTAGLPCRGGEWSSIITSLRGIPLPPLTVAGTAEDFPSGSWHGFYLSLCSGATINSIDTFTSTHMSANGWVYGAPPSDCTCNGLNVWVKLGDPRLIQFEPNPAQRDGQVVWGIFIYTHS
jgi:hypothetical protein